MFISAKLRPSDLFKTISAHEVSPQDWLISRVAIAIAGSGL